MMLRCLAGLAILLATSVASAAPSTLTFAGRLSTSSGPVNGQVTVQFRLFTGGSGGTAVWGPESHTVTADNGLVYANLGTLSTLDQSIFNGEVMYLEIQVGSEVLSPRLTINSVPYALQSETANLLGGTIGANDVVTDITAGTNITATKTGNDVTVGLVTTGCSTGQVYKWNGSAFACAADTNTTYTGSGGISVSGSTISLSTTGCSSGYVWKYNGSAWACADDAGTTYTGSNGIAVSGTTISLSTSGCAAGEVWKYNGSTFSCDPDVDTNTTYVGGTGITVSGSTISLSTSGCALGEVWTYTSSGFSCESVATTEVDGVIGNEVTNATNASLTRSGSGTAGSPYTLGLNLANANTWTAAQTFSGGVRASTFDFSSQQTGSIHIPGSAFHPEAAAAFSSNGYVSNATGIVYAPALGLPDGVTIVNMACQYYANDSGIADASQDFFFLLRSRQHTSLTASNVIYLNMADQADSTSIRTGSTTAAHLVDNGTNSYFLYVNMPNSSGMRLYGCSITYNGTTNSIY